MGCAEPASGPGPGEGDEQFRGGTEPGEPAAPLDSAFRDRLVEAHDQLVAGDWRPYLSLRSEVSLGGHEANLTAALADEDPVVARMAAVSLEDRLVSDGAPEEIGTAARSVLVSALDDDATPRLKPPSIRTLGRLTRGSSQAALLAAHLDESDPTLRQMLLSALGDNADKAGLAAVRSRVEATTACAEIRHGVLAVRRSVDALETDGWPWLADVASPRVLDCADEVAESGEAPDADLIALVAAFDRPAAWTLVHEVLLGDVGTALRARALQIVLESGDPTAGAALNESLKELTAQGLGEDVQAVINALRGT